MKCQKMLNQLFPVLEWIPRYSLKEDFSNDVIAGATTAIVQIPQSMFILYIV